MDTGRFLSGMMKRTAGVVKDSYGNPVADALVSIEQSSVPFPDMAFRTDAQGRFQLHLPIGERFRLAAHTQAGGYGFIDLEVNSSSTEVIIQTFKT
jgi:hypothetical protein